MTTLVASLVRDAMMMVIWARQTRAVMETMVAVAAMMAMVAQLQLERVATMTINHGGDEESTKSIKRGDNADDDVIGQSEKGDN